jgi:long-subunit acyl-CoA synthetase (AMP-forming)
MTSLIQLFQQNTSLEFIDVYTDKHFKLNELIIDNFDINTPDKKLVFLYLDNSIQSVKTYLTFLTTNHTLALLSPKLNIDFKTQLESTYQPDFIYDITRLEINGYNTLKLDSDVNVHFNKNNPTKQINNNIKLLLSTSGTTGSPKFVKLSESNLVNNALSIVDYLPINAWDNCPLNLPIYYSYGLSVLHTNAIKGGTIICTNRDILENEFWTDFEQYSFTSLAGVPYFYEILNRIGFTTKYYESLCYLTQAGGKLNNHLVKMFAEYASLYDCKFYVMYGQTEATARMSYLAPEDLDSKLGSIGKAIKNGQFTVDKDSEELYYTGPNVFGGYAECLDDLTSFSDDRTLKTGDLARIDEDGFVYITGRSKRFMKLFGMRINLDEVETILKTKFVGSTFVCTGIEDKSLLICSTDKNIDNNIIKQFIRYKLDIHPKFVDYKYIKDIPLTVNGKTDYTEIIKIYK